MDNQDKSKEELIDELQKLQDAYTSLNVLFQSKINLYQSTEITLLESEARYRNIYDNALEGMFRTSLQGKLIEANQALAAMFGYSSPEETVNSIIFTGNQLWLNPEERLKFVEIIEKQNVIRGYECQFKRKDGTPIWVSLNTRLVRDNNGNKLYYEGFVEDISERKQTEELLSESEMRYKLMFENAPLAINITQGTTITYGNPCYLQMFGFSSLDEMKEISPLELFAPEQRPKIMENIQRRANGLYVPNSYETECLRKDGTKFPILMYLTRTTFADGPATLGFFMDISERKQTENALKESEEKFKGIINQINDGIIVFDEQCKVVVWNHGAETIFGVTANETLGKNIVDVQYQLSQPNGVSREQIEMMINKIIKLEAPQAFNHIMEHEILSPDVSNKRTIQDQIFPIKLNGYNLFCSVMRDITNVKQVTKDLKESEERFHSLYDNATIGLYRTTPDGQIIASNPALIKMLGYNSFEDLARRNVEQTGYVDLSLRERFKELLEQHNQVTNFEAEWICKDGTTIFINEGAKAVRNNAGKIIYYDGTVENITERKRAEELLRNSETRYRTLIETANEGILITQGPNLKFVNSMIMELTGHTKETLLSTPFLEFVHPDDRDLMIINYKKRISGEIINQRYHIKILTNNNIEKWVEISGTKIEWEGQPAILNFVNDISERKQAESIVKRNHQFTEALLKSIPTPVFFKDLEGKYLGCNEAFSQQMGVSSEEIKGKTVMELWPGELAEVYHQKDLQLMQNPEHQIYEYKIKDKNGKLHDVIYAKDVFYDEDSKISGIIGAYIDISERKQAERELIIAKEKAEESEFKVRSMFENTLTGFIFFAIDGQVLEANPAAINILGSPSLEDTKRINALKFKSLNEIGFSQDLNVCIKEKKVIKNESIYTTAWGKLFIYNIVLFPFSKTMK